MSLTKVKIRKLHSLYKKYGQMNLAAEEVGVSYREAMLELSLKPRGYNS